MAAEDVDFDGRGHVGTGAGDQGCRGQVVHLPWRDRSEERRQAFPIGVDGEVDGMAFDDRREVRESPPVRGGPAEHVHSPVRLDQRAHQVGTDEPGSSRDDDGPVGVLRLGHANDG